MTIKECEETLGVMDMIIILCDSFIYVYVHTHIYIHTLYTLTQLDTLNMYNLLYINYTSISL